MCSCLNTALGLFRLCLRCIFTPRIFSAALLLSFLPSLANAANLLESGLYEGLMLAVSSEGKVTGYYQEEQGENPGKRCTFFFSGTTNEQGGAKIQSWSSRIKLLGNITAQPDAIVVTIPKGREHDGCGLVLMPEIDQGLSLTRIAQVPWRELRTITATKVHLSKMPTDGAAQKAYLIRGDVVGVLQTKDQWVEVEYVASERRIKGWVKELETGKVFLLEQ